ncbi:MAG: hypothetical protein HYZ91_02670 [Candidatus Omnitrophica bacterium]|nr:hypothetical protein [Candidatus Omnitrophota bacterium]
MSPLAVTRKPRNRRGLLTVFGFTLVELLVAVTMTAILFVGLGTHLRGGIAVWQRVTTKTEAMQRQRVALERLARDLAQAIVYDDRNESYGAGKLPEPMFEREELRMFTVSSASHDSPGRVQFVTYQCGAINGTDGLWRTSRSLNQLRLSPAGAVPALVLPGCRSLSLQYASLPADPAIPLEWLPSWRDPIARLPRLIKASLVIDSEGRRETVERIFAIPSGVMDVPQPTPV